MKTTKNAVTTNREDVESARQKLAQWEADEASAQAELASLQDRAGVEVLDDPEAASTLPRQMQELRDRIDIAERAAEAQGQRVTVAQRAYLSAEALVLEQTVVVARGRLEAHQERTDELLGLLREHEGEFEHVRRVRAPGELLTWKLPTSFLLRRSLEQAEARVEVVRELAEGRDPAVWLQGHAEIGFGTVAGVNPDDLYPPCVWGPDAVVPAPAYLRSVQGNPAEAAADVADAMSA